MQSSIKTLFAVRLLREGWKLNIGMISQPQNNEIKGEKDNECTQL